MTTVLNVSLNDLSSQFIDDLKQKFGEATEVEIRLQDTSPADELFSEDDFWRVVDGIDWSQKGSAEKVAPAVKALSQMPVASICLFADKLSEKLFQLDTRAHATHYAAHAPDNFISADDFLYARCAVVAEGKDFYEMVLNDPAQMPQDIVFEPLLYLADDAFEMKMNVPFNYMPTYNYETQSNKAGWQLTQ
ncbi:MAG: DUF4240 domain-containing protein [Saprospiraceae bacterium]|nr:DUF4240 domain-containing protein [Saprospiraceae bacterium]